MLVREKTHHIELKIHGRGINAVVDVLKREYPKMQIMSDEDDFVNIEDTDFWKATKKYENPANALWVYRDNAGLTLAKLAELTGIAKTHLSEMEHGKRTIGLKTAKTLGRALKCDYHRFL